jgi:hypothetical protein
VLRLQDPAALTLGAKGRDRMKAIGHRAQNRVLARICALVLGALVAAAVAPRPAAAQWPEYVFYNHVIAAPR